MKSPLIRVTKVSKEYKTGGKKKAVLKNISLQIQQGELVCIVGPSGSGKSTLLRIMLGLIQPSSGSVITAINQQTSLVFQGFALFPWLNVAENIGYGLKMQRKEPSEIALKVAHLLKVMGLDGQAAKHPRELSGGMKQRVGIARALAVDPDILYLDEPFSALDVFTAEQLRQETLSLWQEQQMTVVMVTHLVEEAVEMATKVVVMGSSPGEIKAILPIDLARPRNNRSKDFYRYVDQINDLIRREIKN